MKRVFSVVLKDPNYKSDELGFPTIIAENAEEAIRKAKSKARRENKTQRYRLVQELRHLGRAI